MAEHTITLVVLACDQRAVMALLAENDEYHPIEVRTVAGERDTPDLVEMEFDAVPGIDLEIELAMEQRKIPYSKTWDESMDGPAGANHVRFDAEGNSTTILHDFEEAKVDVRALVEARDEGRLEAFVDELERQAYPACWAKQAEDSNKYRARAIDSSPSEPSV